MRTPLGPHEAAGRLVLFWEGSYSPLPAIHPSAVMFRLHGFPPSTRPERGPDALRYPGRLSRVARKTPGLRSIPSAPAAGNVAPLRRDRVAQPLRADRKVRAWKPLHPREPLLQGADAGPDLRAAGSDISVLTSVRRVCIVGVDLRAQASASPCLSRRRSSASHLRAEASCISVRISVATTRLALLVRSLHRRRGAMPTARIVPMMLSSSYLFMAPRLHSRAKAPRPRPGSHHGPGAGNSGAGRVHCTPGRLRVSAWSPSGRVGPDPAGAFPGPFAVGGLHHPRPPR